jgi:uncharacterized protein
MQRFDQLFAAARPLYATDDPGHDLAHIERVLASCRQLGPAEGARLELLLAAAAVHDLVNVPKDHPDRARASELAAERARPLLVAAGFAGEELEIIARAVIEHSFSRGARPSTTESAVLQDADRLDAVGAIGIMRCLSCGALMGASYYDAADPFAARRSLDDRAYSLDHFFVKLFKLPVLMNTAAGRAEAERRVAFMRGFVAQLQTELPAG